ncbi:hypothetical protein AAVH_20324 [Aphelenchoides avenae]|nr:hypothetical protein AAVH_20324 [Aphelenchus avenae]
MRLAPSDAGLAPTDHQLRPATSDDSATFTDTCVAPSGSSVTSTETSLAPSGFFSCGTSARPAPSDDFSLASSGTETRSASSSGFFCGTSARLAPTDDYSLASSGTESCSAPSSSFFSGTSARPAPTDDPSSTETTIIKPLDAHLPAVPTPKAHGAEHLALSFLYTWFVYEVACNTVRNFGHHYGRFIHGDETFAEVAEHAIAEYYGSSSKVRDPHYAAK